MLYEAWKMSDNEVEETQREVEEEIARYHYLYYRTEAIL